MKSKKIKWEILYLNTEEFKDSGPKEKRTWTKRNTSTRSESLKS